MRKAQSGLVVIGLVGVAFAISRCEKVPLTAPAGSTIFLQANPMTVPSNGGRSVVTALVADPTGALVHDGTQVLFITNLGRIDETALTVSGMARVYFVSDARSGPATITAMSGGPGIAPSSSPSASPSTTPTPTSGSGTGGTGQAQITIQVGAVNPTRIVVAADPQRITSPRYTTIVATVFDTNGNPVQNVPVIFSITSVTSGGTTTTTTTTTTTSTTSSTSSTTTTTTTLPSTQLLERLESGGSPRFTDSSGQAFDTLFTTATSGPFQRLVTVTATTSNGVSGTTVVAID